MIIMCIIYYVNIHINNDNDNTEERKRVKQTWIIVFYLIVVPIHVVVRFSPEQFIFYNQINKLK